MLIFCRFKPVDTQALIGPIRERFENLFLRTFKLDSNRQFLQHIQTCTLAARWQDLVALMRHPAKAALTKLAAPKSDDTTANRPSLDEWRRLISELDSLDKRLSAGNAMAFAFIEGALVRALAEGDWVLLDEINLAPAELLDCLGGLLDSAEGSLTLVDRGYALLFG